MSTLVVLLLSRNIRVRLPFIQPPTSSSSSSGAVPILRSDSGIMLTPFSCGCCSPTASIRSWSSIHPFVVNLSLNFYGIRRCSLCHQAPFHSASVPAEVLCYLYGLIIVSTRSSSVHCMYGPFNKESTLLVLSVICGYIRPGLP